MSSNDDFLDAAHHALEAQAAIAGEHARPAAFGFLGDQVEALGDFGCQLLRHCAGSLIELRH